MTSRLVGYANVTLRNSIFPLHCLGWSPNGLSASISGTLSTIAKIVEAAPTAVLTAFTNGSALPREKAPAITLKNTYTRRQLTPIRNANESNMDAYRKDAARRAEAGADETRAEPKGHAVGAVGDEEDDRHADRQEAVLFYRNISAFL